MVKFRLFTTYIVVMALVILATSCKKTTTEETFEPKLLLSNLSVSIVPQGTENITVTATDEYDSTLTFSVECEDENIATVTKTDSTITVTGKNLGTTNVKISCDTDTSLNKTISVQIYDPKVLEAGELVIAFVDQFEYRWCSYGPGNSTDASFYHPITTDGFKTLGSLGFVEYHNPNGKNCIMVVKAKPGSDALKPPVDYDSVWNTQGAGIDDNGSLWNPVPPAGYKALGTVAQQGFNKPSLNDVVCVREDLIKPAELSDSVVFYGYNPTTECEVYMIAPPDVGPHDSCYLKTGTFTGTRNWPNPIGHLVLYVLKVMLPKLAEAPDQTFAPRLTGYDRPPDQTHPIMSKEMSVPWTILNDKNFTEVWRYCNSPTYRVERRVYYRLLFHNYNTTSLVQNHTHSMRCGVQQESSNVYHENTGVSISVETGISYQGVAWGGHLTITGTFSKDFGYETQTNIVEFEERTITTSINTAPGKAAALWQKYNRFIVKRHNGKRLEPVGTYDFGIDSYVIDEYPHE